MNEIRKKILEIIASIAMIAILYWFLGFIGIGCPIKFLTGVSCAGCGMTRAWIALLHFDIPLAFHYHPLFFLPPFAIVFLFREKIGKRLYIIFAFTFILLFVTIYVVRLLDPIDTIVTFHPRDGFIVRLVSKCIDMIGLY